MGDWHLLSVLRKQYVSQTPAQGMPQVHRAILNSFISGVGTDLLPLLGDEDDSRPGTTTGCFKITLHEYASDFS